MATTSRHLALLVAVALGIYAVSGAPSFCGESGWDELWSDEFEGNALNTSDWNVAEHGPGGSDTRDASATSGECTLPAAYPT